MTISKKIIAAILAGVFLPMAILALLGFSYAKNSLVETRIESLEAIADLKKGQIELFFDNIRSDIKIVQDYYNIKLHLPALSRHYSDPANYNSIGEQAKLDAQLHVWNDVKPAITDLMLTDKNGRLVYSLNHPHDLWKLKSLPDPGGLAFSEGSKGIFISDIFVSESEEDKLSLLVSAPIHSFDGEFIGVVAFEVDMAPIDLFLRETAGLGETGETLVGTLSGDSALFINTLRHDPESAMKRTVPIGSRNALPIQEAVRGRDGSGISVDYWGVDIIAVWRYIPSLDWGMVAKIDTKEAFASIARLKKVTILISILILLFGSMIAIIIGNSISKPIARLEQGVKIIGSGDLGHRVGTKSPDEVGSLSRAFDRMTDSLDKITASRDELNNEVKERKWVEERLREQKNLFETILASTTDMIYLKDSNSVFMAANPAFCAYVDKSEADIIGKNNYDLFPEKFAEIYTHNDKMILSTGKEIICEEAGSTGKGENRWYSVHKNPVLDSGGKTVGVIATIRDITARKERNERLKEALEEKEVLLKEVHHRVKNNMQVITSMLSLQSAHSDIVSDLKVQEVFRESQERIRSMAMVHEQLYSSGDLGNINFADYIREITGSILRIYNNPSRVITVVLQVDDIKIDIDSSINLGLILNELCSNAMKYAFPNMEEGEITVILKRIEAGRIMLSVKDNGIGLPESFSIEEASSMGLQLIDSMITQLDGEIKIDGSEGASFDIIINAG